MSFALLRKELREHGAVLVAVYVLAALMLTGLLIQANETLGGRFMGLMRFTLFFAPLLALVFANRLFVREYSGRTQLYLETLPIGRKRVFWTKWLLGGALCLLTAWLAWYASWRFSRATEVLAWGDARWPLLSVLIVWLAVWSFAALAGMLGRYRYVIWGALVIVLMIASSVAAIPMFELPVVRLLGVEMQNAMGLAEPAAFIQAGFVIAVSIVSASALALAGSGGIASTLARRMTARERVFVLVAAMAVLTVAFMLEPQPERPPFEITDGQRVNGQYARVGVLPTVDFGSGQARELARILADDVDGLVERIGIDGEPRVFILPQQGVDRHVMQRAALGDADGIVLQVAPDVPRDSVRTLVAHSLLTDWTLDRGMREDRHVLLDGLSTWWAVRDDAAGRERYWLRVAALDTPLDAGVLTNWALTSERYGECQALSIAFATHVALEQALGEAALFTLLRELLARPPEDARVLFEKSPAAQLRSLGLDWPGVAAAAEALRQSARAQHAEALAARPDYRASIDWQASQEYGIEIETTVAGAERYAAYYSQLGPWTADIGRMARLDVFGEHTILPLAPPRGARVLVVIEVDDPVLDCPVRLVSERLELR